MNTAAGRIKKEAMTLFWPWCAVMFAGISAWLPLGPSHFSNASTLYMFGLWIGVPLLAALSFGNEFQHGTMTLLLSQPVARTRIWFEKMILLTAAVLTTVAVYSMLPHQGLAIAGLWFLIAVCSSTFWTLVAKSTIGGLVLNLIQGMVILFILVESSVGPTVSIERWRQI